MNPAQQLQRAGLSLTLTPSGQLLVKPKALITDDVRAFVAVHRTQIVASLIPAANDADVHGNLGTGFVVGAAGAARPAPRTTTSAEPPEAPTTASSPAPALAVPPAPTVPAMPRIWPPMNAAEVAQAVQHHARLVAGGMDEREADREADLMLLADRAGSTVPTPAPTPAPARKKPQALHGSAHHPAWAAADRVWQTHLWNCPACISAGKLRTDTRCPEGEGLFQAALAENPPPF